MNKTMQKITALAIAATIGGSALLPFNVMASENATEQAIREMVQLGVLHGYEDQSMKPEKPVTQAELAKMIVLSLQLQAEGSVLKNQEHRNKWYTSYVNTAVASGILVEEKLQPNQPVASDEFAAALAKALQRDVLSIKHWMKGIVTGQNHVTRGEASQILLLARKAVRSQEAQVVSVKALNAITLEVTFSAPLTLNDESIEESAKNFVFDGGLTIVNQPRLKTGALQTYIVPVTTMSANTSYTLSYKGKQQHTFVSSDEKIRMNTVRQVTSDTFEVESLREEGVVDYGYIISAYAGGRGKDAFILDENNSYDGQPFQIISSLRNRTATLTPEGGTPITVNYVGFTQSTDGKQEPKFRLPGGAALTPGVKYTVTSDWFELKSGSFIAEEIAPLSIASASQVDGKTIHVQLSEDPQDELFAFRSVKLIGSDQSEVTAQYRLQSRKGAVGVFDIQNGGQLAPGVSYTVAPVGAWAVAKNVVLKAIGQ
ncbi:S-layer homology domain-containing protein [Paenibacillus sp. GD4]|uniref:S-layer homology domain-containing protein n=1 Tax=Paenibacillus sp. GD4 TaxID=3068890 RepID=UPI002796B568|nr:S-layer homology domain-containing protein [Paenibacillus sp. GD4]MDQ1914498.1 S-layer homology domain-containing protein [Paenibacillus sp. GD4]